MPRATTYNPSWISNIQDSAKWLKASTNGESFAYCSFCNVHINVASSGIASVKQHEKTANHKTKIKDVTGTGGATMMQYFKPTTSKSEKSVLQRQTMEAELRWTLHSIEHNKSLNCEDNSSALFAVMFKTCQIAGQMSCGRNKMHYLICHALAPHFKEEITAQLSTCYFSTSFDESDGYMAIVTRSVNDKLGTINIGLLDVVPMEEFTAEASAKYVLQGVHDAKLPLANWIGDESDNCNTMRG